jgi:hypothetical protein
MSRHEDRLEHGYHLLTVEVGAKIYDRFRRKCAKNGSTVSAVVRQLIAGYIANPATAEAISESRLNDSGIYEAPEE